jgi:hypothetical protein
MSMPDPNPLPDIETFLREVFEQNYEELRLDSGHAIAPDVKKTALQQVLLYWRKLSRIAENVTDTEVRLSLPGQETPKGRDFTIEGVIDILRENERTVMYDIKTHDAEYVRANIEPYEAQLNVYAHIWHELRGQPLDGTAVIATDFPEEVRSALASENEEALIYALAHWEPVVEIDFDPRRVVETIRSFGAVVDCIEDGSFSPPDLGRLQEAMPGTRHIRFGTHVCRNCDARFSCGPYREFSQATHQSAADRSAMQYFSEAVNDVEQEAWRTGNLDAARGADELRRDFSTR